MAPLTGQSELVRESENGILLKVSNLSVRADHQAMLKDVSFSVRKGATLAIVGPNGAGKTTLFRALLNLTPYTGKIEWSQKVRIGYVPQHFAVTDVPISVSEFLSLKCKTDFEGCLAAVGLEAAPMLNRKLGVLSGGEMERVLIAWAIVDKPEVLLFDEPTASVDIGSKEVVYETLNKLEKETGITVLLITHDIHVIMHYSDITLALNGSVLYFGESNKLTDPTLLERIYGSSSVLELHEH
ncbi:MAG TPA: metal ABC transporter ATP-binding protein [Terriglobales bacterium]|nr:metal ABC transporter ATP-binding protein [Terriglobales bacterium]